MNALKNKFKEELILLDIEVENKEDLLKIMADILYDGGYVKESFYKSLLVRESAYPTGLELEKYNIAIPHTDVEHVINEAVVVARLKDEVVFKNMVMPTADVSVKLVFMMAINNPKNHIPVLSGLMNKLGNKETIISLINAADKNKFIKILEEEV